MQSLLLYAESIDGNEWWASWPRFVIVIAVATSVTTCGCGIIVWTCFVWTTMHLHLWTTCSCGWIILKFICICGLPVTIWTACDAYIYTYSILHSLVTTPTYVSHHILRIWPNEEYVHGVCDYTWTFVMVYTLGM